MDAQDLKDRIISEDRIRDVLVALNMKHIKEHQKNFSCCMPDGDNKSSTIVYKNSLHVDAHTRDISDKYGATDLLALVMYIRKEYFSHSIKWICSVLGYDYYGSDYTKPDFLSMLDELYSMSSGSYSDDEDIPLRPIDEDILKYYKPLNSKMFREDGISIEVQRQFEIGFDGLENRITIPIRDENGVLVGVKGRLNYKDLSPDDKKYIYIERCNKSSILYGLNSSLEAIKREGIVYVGESEKALMQAYSNGIFNVVSIGGKKLSNVQVKKLTHLGVDICLCYDDLADTDSNGVVDTEFYTKQKEMFIDGIKVYAIIDKNNDILGKKESPFDNLDMWDELLKMKKIIV